MKNGRIKQSVCKWCYGGISLDELAAYSAKLGIKGIDLINPKDWHILKKHGLECSITPTHSIGKGLNRIENHEECLAKIRKSIDATSDAGFKNVICFSGNRKGMDDDEGLKNCSIALKQIVGYAEEKNVVICMELLNSKRNHKDDDYNPEVTPVKLRIAFEHPANDCRGPINVVWHQGGSMPKSPMNFIDLNRIGHGVMYKGTKGFVIADFGSRIIIPYSDSADMSYYQRRDKDELIPNLGNFQKQWINACKTDLKTSCDFNYSRTMIEQMLLELAAYRAGKKLDYDGKTGKITNDSAANSLLTKEYRKGWTMNG